MTKQKKADALAVAEGFARTEDAWSYMGEKGVNVDWKLWDNKGHVLVDHQRDYFEDINDVRMAEERLLTTPELKKEFVDWLGLIVGGGLYEMIHAEAKYRAEALGRTFKLWAAS